MTEECQGCAKLRALYKNAHSQGVALGKAQFKYELEQARKYIDQFNTTFKEQREAFQKEMTDALQEAEDRADYWQRKYNEI